MAIHITRSSGTMYGRAKVVKADSKTVTIRFQSKDNDKSTKGAEVWNDPIRFTVDKAVFDKVIPSTVTSIDPQKWFAFASPKVEDGGKLDTIYQFRPWTEEEVAVKFRGFARDDKQLLRLSEAFKNDKQKQAIAEFIVVRGPWAGVVYPYRYFNVNDKFGNFIFEIADHELHIGWLGKAMENILATVGFFDSESAQTTKLADTSDPEVVLSWIERIIRKADVELGVTIVNGYPDIQTLHVFDGDDVDDDFDADDSKDEDEDDATPAKVAKPVTTKAQPKRTAMDDEDDED